MTAETPGDKIPLRICVGCRARKEQTELRRLCLEDGPDGLRVIWDECHRKGGRGAWLCRVGESCLVSALKKKVFTKAFKVEEKLNVAGLVTSRAAPLRIKKDNP